MTSSRSSLLLLVLVALLSATLHVHAQALRALSDGSAAHGDSTAGSTSTKSESHEAKVESPSTVSFTGPLIAGALAVVLIGAVVKFRTRTAAQ